jgi:cell division protein ZapA
MAKVSISINGRKFALGCDEGEEDRLLMLGDKLDKRVKGLADQFGQIGDLRLLLMAGITLMDELEDAGSHVDVQAEALAADIRRASEDAIDIANQKEASAADSLIKAAESIEKLAERLSET